MTAILRTGEPLRTGLGARLWGSASIGERSDLLSNRSTGFDYLRIALAGAIILYHTTSLSYGDAAQASIERTIVGPLEAALVPMFFALSGYLVAASLDRSATLFSFLGLRVIRIMPALAVETVLSALIIGPIFTTLALGDYFADPKFWHYLRNCYGDIHYFLPGVFVENPKPQIINGQLWTIRPELMCYLAISVLALFGVRRWRWLAPVGVVTLLGGIGVLKLLFHIDAPQFVGGAWSSVGLVAIFLMGVCLHKYRDAVPWSHAIGIPALALSIALLALPHGHYFAYAPMAYATVYLGLLNPPKPKLLGGDYSYGMYLYGFVLQQSFAALGPWAHHWWLNGLICTPLAWGVAVLSWRLVERPAQDLRKPLFRLEQKVLPFWPGAPRKA